MKVNSFDEWTQLKQVIVGHADGYNSHDIDSSFRLFYLDNVKPPDHMKEITIPAKFVDELQEDIELLVETLQQAKVEVLRPAPLRKRKKFVSPNWESREVPPLNIRDQTIIIGETIVETAPHQRARYFENNYLKPLFYKYFQDGSSWVSMPNPTLGRYSLDESFFDFDTEISYDDASHAQGIGFEMILDGAQCIRFGKDIIVNVANRNHQLGLAWLRRVFNEFTFWELNGVADSHIDSLIVPLRPGLLMLRNSDLRSYLPPKIQSWDTIYPPEIAEDNFPDYSHFGFNLASKYIDTNVLSINETTVIANSLCPEIIKLLDSNGFDVIPVRHRHRRLYNGGFHCFTLDTVRTGKKENYFD